MRRSSRILATHAPRAKRDKCLRHEDPPLAWLFALSLLCLPLVASADQQLSRLLDREEALLHQLTQTVDDLTRTQHQLTDAAQDAPVLQYRLVELQRQMAALRHRRNGREAAVKRWSRMLYALSRGGYARLTLSAADRQSVLFRRAMLAHLLRRDAAELDGHTRGLKALGELQRRLRRRRDAQLSQLQSLRLQRLKLVDQREQLERALHEASTERRRYPPSPQLEQQRQRVRQLEEALKADQGHDSLDRYRGRLPWPLVGQLIGRFEQTHDSRTGLTVARSGITIGCGPAAVVRAVHEGTVRYSGTLRGLGKLVLLEHTGGYFTVYGFLRSTAVTLGQRVERNTVIGKAGVDPLHGRPALYFELRSQRHAEDPLDWLAR